MVGSMIFTSAEMMNEIIPEYVGKSKGEPCFYFVKYTLCITLTFFMAHEGYMRKFCSGRTMIRKTYD